MKKLSGVCALAILFSGSQTPTLLHAAIHAFGNAHLHQHDGHAHSHEHDGDRTGHHHEIALFSQESGVAPQAIKIDKPHNELQSVPGEPIFLNGTNLLSKSAQLLGIGPPNNHHAFLLASPPTGRAPPA